jgi:hypothetical protein
MAEYLYAIRSSSIGGGMMAATMMAEEEEVIKTAMTMAENIKNMMIVTTARSTRARASTAVAPGQNPSLKRTYHQAHHPLRQVASMEADEDPQGPMDPGEIQRHHHMVEICRPIWMRVIVLTLSTTTTMLARLALANVFATNNSLKDSKYLEL